MLKQQLQKTQEEFDELLETEYPQELNGIIRFLPVKQLIRQAQIDAVKAFAEEIKMEEIHPEPEAQGSDVDDYMMTHNHIVSMFNDKINNLLKDI